ncbi:MULTISPECIES: thioesterase II family protein [Actinosynnema]|uniref:Thioesterase n=1 Tax=Actinosynnema pretiosum TaxID=42197 RepID=A0A290Z8J3_9PSEU|nr:alpha/beta fold hydrolase [Actinosynnema pretiosum]ATE55289.1 thioesterase [Actinosynnema pretiosum]
MIVDETAARWARTYHPNPTAPVRLVCFPHAGGSASYYHPLSARFGPSWDVVALQYPGRQDRRLEPCVDDLERLADLVADVLRGLPAKPTVFFGHSMGAALAFETAVRLERDGAGPREVVASGRRGPNTRADEQVHLLDDRGVLAEVRALSGTDSALLDDEELMRMALPAIRADYTAIETYRCPPDRRIAADLTVLTGDADPKTTVEEAAGWEPHTTGAFQLEVFPGGHFFIATQARAVGDRIERALKAAL